MKTAILLYVFISFVNGEICRKVFCEDNYAGEMKVTELKYNLTDVNSTFVENRVLKTMYFQKKGFSEIHRNPSSMEFELYEYTYGEGYEFKQGVSQVIPSACLKKMKVPNHIAVGLFIPEYDSRRYRFEEKTSFFHARNSKLSGKFICSGSGFMSGECSIIETKWVYQIPYEGKLINEENDCECGKVSGMLVRHTDFSTMIKVLEKREGFKFD